jgi:hypothetical protein
MLNVRFVPLERPKSILNRRAIFKSSYAATLSLLEREMRHLSAQNVVIQAGFTREQVRNDGWPRSGARPSHPAVVVSFRSRGKDLSFPCSTYRSHEDNLRAIALSLEALRGVNRYGVTQNEEQYKGWAQLPPPTPAQKMSRFDACIFLQSNSDVDAGSIGAFSKSRDEAYRQAARRLHPDAGGNHEQFVRLQEAMRVLAS